MTYLGSVNQEVFGIHSTAVLLMKAVLSLLSVLAAHVCLHLDLLVIAVYGSDVPTSQIDM